MLGKLGAVLLRELFMLEIPYPACNSIFIQMKPRVILWVKPRRLSHIERYSPSSSRTYERV
jgi:hypothetical protein